ncbi:hypothetical protein V8D89_003320 [Ganoderma adspersum]
MNESALKTLDRKALQKLAKTNGIKANLKSCEIIKQLLAKQPSKPSSWRRSNRPTPSPPKVRRRSTAQGQPQPNVSATSQPPADEDDAEPVQGVPSSPIPGAQAPPSQPSPAPPASAAQRPLPSTTKPRGGAAAGAQLKTSKPRLFHPRDDDEEESEYARSISSEPPTHGRRPVPSRVSRGRVSPPQPSSPSPRPVGSRRRLSPFQQYPPTFNQPEAGPSRTKTKAPTLGVFNESSASRAPWPQESRDVARRPPSPSSPSPPPGSPRAISNIPIFPPGTHPYSFSTGNPHGAAIPSYHRSMAQSTGHAAEPGTSASASASVPRGGRIVPVPGYRSRSPTPLEEYDSLRGVPLFPMPDSDYEESWTPYSPQGKPSHGYMPTAAAGPGAQHPEEPSPVFRLSRAVFSPPEADYSPPSRSPVFRRPSPPFRPTNPVGRDEYSPDVEPQQYPAGVPYGGEEGEAAAAEAGDELEDYEDDDDESEEDEGLQPATDAELHGMVVRLAILARHQSAAQTGLDDMTEEAERLHKAAPRIRAQLRQERAGFERMHAYLKHLNPRVKPMWDHKAIWDTACLLRGDGHGNELEVETSDEEEAAWRRDNPVPRGAPATEIEMMRFTPWFPGACEDEDRDNVRDVGTAMGKARAEWKAVDAIRARARGAKPAQRKEAQAPRTPKRRRNDDYDDDTDDDSEDDGGRAKKKVRGSAGRTPPPQAFFGKGKGKQRADVETPPLLGIAEEDSEEEDMEMTSVV